MKTLYTNRMATPMADKKLYEVRQRCKIIHRRQEYYPGDKVELTDYEAKVHGVRIRPVQPKPPSSTQGGALIKSEGNDATREST